MLVVEKRFDGLGAPQKGKMKYLAQNIKAEFQKRMQRIKPPKSIFNLKQISLR